MSWEISGSFGQTVNTDKPYASIARQGSLTSPWSWARLVSQLQGADSLVDPSQLGFCVPSSGVLVSHFVSATLWGLQFNFQILNSIYLKVKLRDECNQYTCLPSCLLERSFLYNSPHGPRDVCGVTAFGSGTHSFLTQLIARLTGDVAVALVLA